MITYKTLFPPLKDIVQDYLSLSKKEWKKIFSTKVLRHLQHWWRVSSDNKYYDLVVFKKDLPDYLKKLFAFAKEPDIFRIGPCKVSYIDSSFVHEECRFIANRWDDNGEVYITGFMPYDYIVIPCNFKVLYVSPSIF